MDGLILVVLALMFWMSSIIAWVFPTRPPVMFAAASVILAIALAWAAPRMLWAYRQLRHLRLARDGERAVAECLDIIRDDGAYVLHDLVGEGFNVDHVVVGTQGVFVIETKTISKPMDRPARIVFDHDQVTVGGFRPDRDPIAQARAQASWLKATLQDMTGRVYPVRPVVVYPGWFVERLPNAVPDVWVLEPKALRAFIAHEPQFLPKPDVRLIVNRLKYLARSGSPAGAANSGFTRGRPAARV
jgi:hypothetical protein